MFCQCFGYCSIVAVSPLFFLQKALERGDDAGLAGPGGEIASGEISLSSLSSLQISDEADEAYLEIFFHRLARGANAAISTANPL